MWEFVVIFRHQGPPTDPDLIPNQSTKEEDKDEHEDDDDDE